MTLLHLGGAAYVLGLSYTAWAVTRSVAGYVAGRGVDRAPGSRLSVGFALFVLAALVYGLAPNAWWIVGGRLAQGLGAGVYWSEILVRAGETRDARQRMRRLALFNAAVALGGIAGAVAGAATVARGTWGRPNWLAAGVLFALMVYALRFRRVPPISDPSSEIAASSGPVPREADGAIKAWSEKGPERRPVDSSRITPRFALGIGMLLALSQLPNLFTGVGLPLFLRDHGLPGSLLGLENAAIVGTTLLGQLLLARFSAADPRPRIRILSVGIIATLAALVLGHEVTFVLLAAIVVLAAEVALLGAVWVHAAQVGAGGNVGTVTGTVRAVSDAISAASFPLVGVAEEALGVAATVMAVLVAAASGLVSVPGIGRRLTPREGVRRAVSPSDPEP